MLCHQCGKLGATLRNCRMGNLAKSSLGASHATIGMGLVIGIIIMSILSAMLGMTSLIR
jgi:hypothetical protein